MKQAEDVRQVNEAFDTFIAQWYDYEPLKKATDETWERFNILLGLDRRLQKELPFFKEAVKKNGQLVADQEEDPIPVQPSSSQLVHKDSTSLNTQINLFTSQLVNPNVLSSNSGLNALLAAAEMHS